MENDKEIKIAIANAVFTPATQVSTTIELLFDFSEQYIDTNDAQKNLLFEIQNRPERIEAKMHSILDMLCQAKEALNMMLNI